MATRRTAVRPLPSRQGPGPLTTTWAPHIQQDQNAHQSLQTALAERVFALASVEEQPTTLSAPGARAPASTLAELSNPWPDLGGRGVNGYGPGGCELRGGEELVTSQGGAYFLGGRVPSKLPTPEDEEVGRCTSNNGCAHKQGKHCHAPNMRNAEIPPQRRLALGYQDLCRGLPTVDV